VGAWLSGCSLGRLLMDRGHAVTIIEKKAFVGGLCITRTDRDGVDFEPFGARTFHSKDPRMIEFVKRFDEFNGYVHRKGMIINGALFPFPISRRALERLLDRARILSELESRPEEADDSNFATACISRFGPTLYKYFIENYTEKMWGIRPKQLTAEWAPERLEFREDNNDELFRGQWQGLPIHGYSHLLEKMLEGIPVRLSTTAYRAEEYDVVVCTGPIDAICGYGRGTLPYRSIRFHYQYDANWEDDNYGTINLPQHPKFIRKCNFRVLHKQASKLNRVQYHEPIAADGSNVPMYPINTKENDALFDEYLLETCQKPNTCPMGRLGLYRYHG